MKQIISTLLFTLISASICAQSQKDIDGFWEIKLGMTIKEVEKVVDVSLLRKNEDVVPPYTLTEDYLGGRLQSYMLGKYIVTSEHDLENIRLDFFDNKLFQIQISRYNYETEDLLNQEYGKPEVEMKGRGLDENLPYRVIYRDWNTNIPNRTTHCTSATFENEDSEITSYTLTLLDIYAWEKVSDLVLKQYLDSMEEKTKTH